MENSSGKTITSLTVDLVFSRPEDDETSKEPPYVYGLHFGPSISSPSDYAQRDPSKVVKPGGTIELTLSDDDHEHIKSVLTKLKYSAGVKQVELILAEVGFEDGTSWTGGVFFTLTRTILTKEFQSPEQGLNERYTKKRIACQYRLR